MVHSLLIKLWKINCIISIIILAGCNMNYSNYDYREEELSKMEAVSVEHEGSDQADLSRIVTSCIIDSDIKSVTGTICEEDPVLVYNYNMMLDKAYVYFAIMYEGYFADVYITIEEYDANHTLLNTVTTNKVNCLGSYPCMVSFESTKDVAYLRIIAIDFINDNSNYYDGDILSFDGGNKLIKFKRLSNTTFEYTSKVNGVIGLLDENGIQLDSQAIAKGKNTIVTVQNVSSYKILVME